MRQWLTSINYEPGISTQALQTAAQYVKNSCKNEKIPHIYFNMTCDEMSIRKQIKWNKQKKIFEGKSLN